LRALRRNPFAVIAFLLLCAACVDASASTETTAVAPSVTSAGAPTQPSTVSTSTTLLPATTASAPANPPPTTVPPTTTTTVPPRGELVIHGVGDVAVDPSYIYTLAVEGYDYALAGLEGLFGEDSLSVINLECAASNLGTPADKEFNFRCDPEALGPLREAGVDVANQANNHFLDFGYEAALDSRANILAAGIASVGAGADPDEAYAPALLEVEGWTIAVLGFGGVVLGPEWLVTDDHPGMANGDSVEDMVAAVAAAEEVSDFVVVTVHWGWERDLVPRPDDIERATAMVDAGADVIFGHHQHRLQPMTVYEGRPIFWGLGNFVWPRISPDSADTAVAEVRIDAEGTISAACLIPATIVQSGHPVLDEPYDGCAGVDSPVYDISEAG